MVVEVARVVLELFEFECMDDKLSEELLDYDYGKNGQVELKLLKDISCEFVFYRSMK